MTEENVDKLIEEIRKRADVPNDWLGFIRVSDVLDLIRELRNREGKRYYF